jgi:puromycin-sensitive aminopeptidase
LRLHIRYTGKLSSGLHGLYLAVDGADRAIVSQCEASDARAIFPCFDEPGFKAPLVWTVRTDPGLTVITNGASVTQRRTGGRALHRFKATAPIPTYLAAVTIGEYDGTPARRIAKVPCRIWSGPAKGAQTGFAEQVTAAVLPWFERYFGKSYAFTKLDQVAVPGFDAGAMENAGAIFYRQGLLLMQPGATSWAAQKRIAEVVAHEIAHMWFGNLVTLAWWDDLWLNEAFATWIAVDLWQPEWRLWDDTVESRQAALAADGLMSTHAIYAEVNNPAEATELFDVITYEKGCAVLRMLERYLGDGRFRTGIRDYMQRFAFGNAAGRDLWDALGRASGEEIEPIATSWINQAGCPLVTVSAGREGSTPVLHLGQRRFFAHPGAMADATPARWQIPIVLRLGDGAAVREQRVLLREANATVTLEEGESVRWCFPNADAVGFYRTQLDDALLSQLLDEGLPALTPAERATLIEDQWALVLCGAGSIDRFMRVLSAFGCESDHIVSRTLANRLAYLEAFLVADADRSKLHHFVAALSGNQWADLGWESQADEAPPRTARRATVVYLLGHVARDPKILAHATELALREMRDPSAVHADIANVVVQLAAQRGDRALLDRFVRTYVARRRMRLAPEVQARYLHALGRFEEPAAVERVLSLCLDGTVPQDQLRAVLTPLLSARASNRRTWVFLQRHWTTLAPRIGDMALPRLVEALGMLPVDLRDEVEGFFAAHPVAEAKRAVHKALEALALRAHLLAREQARLGDWLDRNPPAGGTGARTRGDESSA